MTKLYELVHRRDTSNYQRARWVLEKYREYTSMQRLFKVFDIACGDGTFAAMFAIKNKSAIVTAIDINLNIDPRNMVSGIKYYQSDIFEWDKIFDNRYRYDIIFCGELCEHLPDGKPEELMTAIRGRWLCKNGIFILTVPNFLIKSGGHKRIYDEKSMLELVKNFKVLETAALPKDDVKFHCCICKNEL
jgi:2-polyprenyl-3-methyl-5-hydroxy-6-metoxy-1,4-benzoquinol methylase